jgi:gentisate 1,2-dioxygenase
MAAIKIIKTFKDTKQFWLGLEVEGHRRKVFKAVDEEQIGAEKLVAGLTIFEPGERCAAHSHPGSEEVNFAIRGGGIAIDLTNGKETPFGQNDFIWIPDGAEHVHYNNTEEPLWLLWVYGPPNLMPTDK